MGKGENGEADETGAADLELAAVSCRIVMLCPVRQTCDIVGIRALNFVQSVQVEKHRDGQV